MQLTLALCFTLLTLGAAASAASSHGVPLTRKGQPVASLVLAKQPTVAANFAALELQAHIRKITGATLPIVDEDAKVGGPRVLIGESAATRALRVTTNSLKYQEYQIRFLPDTVVLLGRDAETTIKDGGFPRAPGKFGRACECDGKTAAASIAEPGFNDEVGTLEAWVWMPAATSEKHGTILRLDGADPWTYHIVQRDMNSSAITYTTYDGKEVHWIGSPPLAEGWHHLVATHDLAAGKTELFVDGKSVGAAPYVKSTCSRAPLNLGGLPSDTGSLGNPFVGLIDEVRVSKVVRNVTQDAGGGPYTPDADTSVLRHFDEESGQPLNVAGAPTASAPLPGSYEDRGTLDATYDFLERYCNVRWYAPTDLGTVCPRTPSLTVSGSELRFAPKMIHRWITPTSLYLPGPPDTVPARDVAVWKLRMRIGGQPFWVCHSFQGYYDLYLKDHPDWFAQGYPGQPPQLCYTNPELIAQVVEDARNYFNGKGAPPGAAAMGDVYGLVPMDNNSWCKCPQCQAELNQSQMSNLQFNNGKASDYLFGFVNKVAREVRKTHPDKWIGALAYSDYAYYPERFKVEPNVVIQTCLHTRNWWCPSMEVNDRKVLDDWRRQDPQRPLYLWLYYNFPALNALYGEWHYYPGYFAHTVVEQMKWYRSRGIRGIFMEHSSEFRQSYLMDQLEFYVTLKLACDPSLDGNKLIDEFFSRYYGAAAKPMQALYNQIEETFSNPRNYPVDIQKSPGHQHQTEELAWGSLGTEERMSQGQKLMDQAKAATATPEEKQRVALFEQGQWQYLLEGRKAYAAHAANRAQAPPQVQAPRVTGNAVPAVGSDASQWIDWSQAKDLGGWGTLNGDPTPRKLSTRLAHDGAFLYVQLTEELDPAKLVATPMIYDGDDWEVFIALQRNAGRRQVCVSPTGQVVSVPHGEAEGTWDGGAVVASDTKDGRWTVRLALPLDRLLPGGLKPGSLFYANFYRASPRASNLLSWTPTFASGFHDTSHLAEISLAP